jgi:peptidoglycan lytic transglycosylase
MGQYITEATGFGLTFTVRWGIFFTVMNCIKQISPSLLMRLSGTLLILGLSGCGRFSLFEGESERSYDQIIREKAAKYSVDSRLIKAVIWQESRFRADAVGRHGEVGLMQIMPNQAAVDWARAKRVKVPSRGMLFKPELNIEIGTWYLSRGIWKYRYYKDVFELALCRYNAGQSRADKWAPSRKRGDVIKRITISSTREYVTQIMKRYKYYCRKKD